MDRRVARRGKEERTKRTLRLRKELKKYPLPLQSGQEAKHLIGYVGDRLANMLDASLAKHRASSSGREDVETQIDVNPTKKRGRKKKKPTEDDEGEAGPPPKQKTKSQGPKKKKEYLPQYRTGPYALLVTLFRCSQEIDYKGYMTKAELLCSAQQYCDSSLTIPKPDTDYTAWSSMGGLVRRALVEKYSNPAKYRLTLTGTELGEKLNRFQENMEDSDEDENRTTVVAAPSKASLQQNKLEYSDTDEDDCKAFPLAKLTQSRDTLKDAGIPARREKATSSLSSSQPSRDVVVIDSSSSDENTAVEVPPARKPHTSAFISIESSDSESETAPSSAASSQLESTPALSLAFSSYSLHPGQYDIVLCIDHCETGAAERRIQVIQELRKNGVLCDIRKLNVGDYLWIAKERKNPIPGQLALPDGQEVVLDYIVERKREDDLSKSIIDGRFKGQKARLHECGCSQVIYLIEQRHFRKPLSLPEASVKQAIVNTQVRDKFMIRRTSGFAETVSYLTLMTRMITDLYKGKVLTVCPKNELVFHADKPRTALMSFLEFNQASKKSKPLTVREMFLKQLIAIQGVSQDKAQAVVDFFSTPALLWEAYEMLPSDDERRKMLAEIVCGNERKLGPKLSEKICKYYTGTSGP
ncbi:crossover junction endonuclease MUS81-like isoform X2 [Oscarella lobularis]|uniref:crossover junction endonuclease MUS81-like isoform X2 n=1 Tax=Oscarella lobularis TaxID=121494 RepID=UPI00331341FA